MKKISVTTRLSFSLTGLLVSLMLFGNLLGIFPDTKSITLRSRTQLSEAIALAFAGQATRADAATVQRMLTSIQSRNADISSIGIRQANGGLLASAGNHDQLWNPRGDGKSTVTEVRVPLGSGSGQWGGVELTFLPLAKSQIPLMGRFNPLVITGCLGLLTFCMYMVYLRFALRALNPSKVVPQRVNEALNTLAEGVLVLDKNERIVLANTSFATAAGIDGETLLGKRVSELPWHARDEDRPAPWTNSMKAGTAETGILLDLDLDGVAGRTYSVNSVPISDDKGACRGVLASFEDVTEIERKNVEMSRMLDKLRKSAKQVNRQNRELERLATRDPLTNCLNRRAFFEKGEEILRAGERYEYPVSIVMLDVDHFKKVNDDHGHAMGDEVLQRVGITMLNTSRETDLVCRYGGEEFCILMPHIDMTKAAEAAERLRIAIADLEFDELRVTSSFGVSDLSAGANDIQEMLDKADRSLYAAKRTGRNRVVRFDHLEDMDVPDHDADGRSSGPPVESSDEVTIPYRVVTALLSAMAFRDRGTAEHGRRVADLCVLLAEDLVSRRRCYIIETAALLHDIGKIGVPDSILLKPGKLTEAEWRVMEKHDLIGAEIIRASFASDELSAIIEAHHHFFSGTPKLPHAPNGLEIPLGARVLAIADAYDAMTSNRVYRKARTSDEAFAELRRCSGTQFDPELVELFIHKMHAHTQSEPVPQFGVSKSAALQIGLQLEELVAALDDRDLKQLAILNDGVHQIAIDNAVGAVAEKSDELRVKLKADEDLIDILYTAGELLEACRLTQSSFFEGSEFRAPVGEPELLTE
jgi:diguanylate cyclase (GGDEF)-like protein/putative nucleotidyltransferase with HDIG domain/PAS domain S-box-containing protein